MYKLVELKRDSIWESKYDILLMWGYWTTKRGAQETIQAANNDPEFCKRNGWPSREPSYFKEDYLVDNRLSCDAWFFLPEEEWYKMFVTTNEYGEICP